MNGVSDNAESVEMTHNINPDIHIPEKAPRIGVQINDPQPDNIRIALKGDPFHFGSFSFDDEFIICDYDLPDETLTQVSHGYTRGPILFRGYQCTEIFTREQDTDGNALQIVRRLVVPGRRFAKILLVCLRRPSGMGSVEITNLEFPLFLEPRIRWLVVGGKHDSLTNGPEINIERITGLVDVFIGKQSFQCFRWLRPRTTGIGHREAEEIFTDINTGLTVLIRGFVGSDYPKLEQFQRSPQLEIAGEIFYLQYIRRVIRY
jgi:hypothetical protein